MASELVPVEQEDREAAAGLMRAWKMLPDRLADHVLEGDEDSTVFVQAFARHRLAALGAQASRIAELEAGHEQAWRDGFQSARDCLSGTTHSVLPKTSRLMLGSTVKHAPAHFLEIGKGDDGARAPN